MKTIKARIFSDKEIVVSSTEELDKMYNLISGEENFIIEFELEGSIFSEVIISNNLTAKVKNGEILLRALNEVNKK